MDSTSNWYEGLVDIMTSQVRTAIEYLPGIVSAIIVLAVGWIVARLLRRAVHSASRASSRIVVRFFPGGVPAGARVSPFVVTLIGEIIFWSVIFLAVTAAARVAGLNAISDWLDRIAIYLPNLIAAFAIVVAGYLGSIFVRQQATPKSTPALSPGQANFAGRVAQGAIIAIALTMALDQVGIDMILPVALLLIGAASIAITFGISLALGARSHMSNLIGMRSLRGQLTPGLQIRINGVHGRVLELTASQLMLETDEGRALVPGRVVSESITTILTASDPVVSDNE